MKATRVSRTNRYLVGTVALALAGAFAFQTPPAAGPVDRVADPFATGWMLVDTNGDGIADFISGKVVVPTNPSAAENAAAARCRADPRKRCGEDDPTYFERASPCRSHPTSGRQVSAAVRAPAFAHTNVTITRATNGVWPGHGPLS